jgi:hypothetical protein
LIEIVKVLTPFSAIVTWLRAMASIFSAMEHVQMSFEERKRIYEKFDFYI